LWNLWKWFNYTLHPLIAKHVKLSHYIIHLYHPNECSQTQL
jgi:hypothetical protein